MPGSNINAGGNNQSDAHGEWADAVLQAFGINPSEATLEQTDGQQQDDTRSDAVKHLLGELASFEQKVEAASVQWSPTCKPVNAPEFTKAYGDACAAIQAARDTAKVSDLGTKRQCQLMQEKLSEAQDHYGGMQKQYESAKDFLSTLIDPAKEQASEISASLAELAERRSEIEGPGVDLSSFDDACQQVEELSEKLHQAHAETDGPKVAHNLSALKMAFSAAKKAFSRRRHRSQDTGAEVKAQGNESPQGLDQIIAEASKFDAPVRAMKQRRLKIKATDVDLSGYNQALTMFERVRTAFNMSIEEGEVAEASEYLKHMKSVFSTLQGRYDKLLVAVQKAEAVEPEGTGEELVRIQGEARALCEKALALQQDADDLGGTDTDKFNFQNALDMIEHARTMLDSAISERDTREADYYLGCISSAYSTAQTELEKLRKGSSEPEVGEQEDGVEEAGSSSELFAITTEAKQLYDRLDAEVQVFSKRRNELDKAGLDRTLLRETVGEFEDEHAYLIEVSAIQNIDQARVTLEKMRRLNGIMQQEFDKLYQALARAETGPENAGE